MSPTGWTTVRVRRSSDPAAAIRALFSLGAEGVQELDGEVLTHLRNLDIDAARRVIAAADAAADVAFAELPHQDWAAEWRARVGAHRLDKLVVTPPWLAEQFSQSERVVIDPAMAFGTGEHETTRSVLRLMQRIVHPDDLVVDVGAGSAVLAIAAARLGARRAIAIEIDADAISNAEENIAVNGVADRVTVIEGDATALLPLVAPARVVLANIISSVLVQLLPVIGRSLTADGVAILSGILLEERDAMEAILDRNRWRIVADESEGAWWTVAASRK